PTTSAHSRRRARTAGRPLRSPAIDGPEHRAERMAAVVAAVQQIAAERAPQALLQRVCVVACEVTLAQRAAIGFTGDDRAGVRWMASSGVDDGMAAWLPVPSPETSAIGPVLAGRRTVRMLNPDGRRQYSGLADMPPPTYSCL